MEARCGRQSAKNSPNLGGSALASPNGTEQYAEGAVNWDANMSGSKSRCGIVREQQIDPPLRRELQCLHFTRVQGK